MQQYSQTDKLRSGEFQINMKLNLLPAVLLPFIGTIVLAGCSSDQTATGDAPIIQTGAEVFAANCASCHGQDATGAIGPNLHNLSLSKEQIATTVQNGKGRMPALGATLTAAQQEQVVNYVASLKGAQEKP